MNTNVRSYIERIKERNKREREGGADSSMMENQKGKEQSDLQGSQSNQITKSELQLYKNYQVKYELEKLITTNQSEELSQYQERTIHLLEEKWKLLVLLERTEKEKEEMMASIQQLNRKLQETERKVMQLESDYGALYNTLLEEKCKHSHTINSLTLEYKEYKEKYERLSTLYSMVLSEKSSEIIKKMNYVQSIQELSLVWGDLCPSNPTHVIKSHLSGVTALSFTLDGQYLCGMDGWIHLWNPDSSNIQTSFHVKKAITSLALYKQNVIVGTISGMIHCWNYKTDTCKVLNYHHSIIRCLCVHKDLLLSSSNDYSIHFYDLKSNKGIHRVHLSSICISMVCDPHKNTLLTAHADRSLQQWSLTNTPFLNNVVGLSPSAITSLSYCHDSINGDRLLLSCMDHSLEVYDGEILVSIKTLKNKNMKIENLCNQAILSPHNTYAVTGTSNGDVFLFNISTGEIERILTNHKSEVHTCAWNPQKSQLATGDSNGIIILWSDS